MLRLLFGFLTVLAVHCATAQDVPSNIVTLSGAIGNSEGSGSLEYFRLWTIGKSSRFQIGGGARFTSYVGSQQYYTSAPAALAKDDAKVDSFLIQSPQVNALNLSINFGYRIFSKLDAGFNIDVIGFSFGAEKSGSYLSEATGTTGVANPTSFNILLVGNNDKGTLNSEFYLRYFVGERWAIKAAFQYLFTEYTTDTEIQQIPEGNDRFRNKSGLFSVGITRTF
jgi:hypothetical protein